MTDATHCYLGRIPGCNHVVSVIVDAPDDTASTARELARWVREGRQVERVTVEEARTAKLGCACSKGRRAPKPEPAQQLSMEV
jgi:hypothetical protein